MPEKKNYRVSFKRTGNFEKLIVVKITDDFWFSSRVFDRDELREGRSPFIKTRFGVDGK